MTFEQAVAFVFTAEGEWNRRPDDPGGETRFGISAKAHPGVDLDRLTREAAAAIYRTEYWDRLECEALPAPLRLPVFDGAVQHGPRVAVKLLQQSVGATPDGVMGPETRAACVRAAWPEVLVDYLARRARLYAIQPGYTAFGFGWLRRVLNVQRAVYDAQGGA
jgi:lysozyme family protein